MSAGHHHSSSVALEREVQKLLARPDIIAYLKRPFVSASAPMPLTGGSSRNGKTYYVDPNVAKGDRDLVLWHERVEKALRDVLGYPYGRAHALATAAEKLKAGSRWQAYKPRIRSVVRRDEKERVKMPADYDWGPAKESGLMHLFR